MIFFCSRRVLNIVNYSLLLRISKRFKHLDTTNAKMKVFTQKRNPITGCTEWDIQHEDYDYHQEIARSAFADMLHDTERNQKYEKALKLAIDKMHEAGKPANVLDIGTGTGLLSIMAARCGADSIVACEAFKPMAECCIKILEQNGVADKITVIPKRSTELTVGEGGDLKQKANILVTEVFDTELIGEGALSTFSHAHKNLLEKDCIVVPDSAVIYAQVVECPVLQKWNKLNDLYTEDLDVVLSVPPKMKECAGSAAVHDLQLSQVPRHTFVELSDQIPVFYYDWSGKTPLDMKRTVRQEFSAIATGEAHVVFMWWELNMDTEGKIVLSCAPWWTHPDTNMSSDRPQDTIPWRDHWMQAVYYLPKPVTVKKHEEFTLVSCQDEYSLWFFLENETTTYQNYQRPVCECGVHMAFSRTHVSYLNDGRKSKKLLKRLEEEFEEKPHPVILDLNGSSLLGLAAAKFGAKKVYIMENTNLNIGILTDFMKHNEIENVEFVSEDVDDEFLARIELVICDPNLASAILPWENLRMAHFLNKYRNKLRMDVAVIPEQVEFWAMPVEFTDLHKIRIPLESCEGINMSLFDDLVERSRLISDCSLESQPLWEYPGRCRGTPRRLLRLDLRQLRRTYASNEAHPLTDSDAGELSINGIAVWAVWTVGKKCLSGGLTEWPATGDWLHWDTNTRQAVKLLKKSYKLDSTERWTFQVTYDLDKGQFNIAVDLTPGEPEVER